MVVELVQITSENQGYFALTSSATKLSKQCIANKIYSANLIISEENSLNNNESEFKEPSSSFLSKFSI